MGCEVPYRLNYHIIDDGFQFTSYASPNSIPFQLQNRIKKCVWNHIWNTVWTKDVMPIMIIYKLRLIFLILNVLSILSKRLVNPKGIQHDIYILSSKRINSWKLFVIVKSYFVQCPKVYHFLPSITITINQSLLKVHVKKSFTW